MINNQCVMCYSYSLWRSMTNIQEELLPGMNEHDLQLIWLFCCWGIITRLLIVSCLYLCAANQLSILSMYLDGEECYKGILPVVCCAGYKVMHMSDLLGKVQKYSTMKMWTFFFENSLFLMYLIDNQYQSGFGIGIVFSLS